VDQSLRLLGDHLLANRHAGRGRRAVVLEVGPARLLGDQGKRIADRHARAGGGQRKEEAGPGRVELEGALRRLERRDELALLDWLALADVPLDDADGIVIHPLAGGKDDGETLLA